MTRFSSDSGTSDRCERSGKNRRTLKNAKAIALRELAVHSAFIWDACFGLIAVGIFRA
jgi:hypothetical protein